MRNIRLALICCGLSAALVPGQDRAPLTDQRITDMVSDGVSNTEIMRIIATAPRIDFDLTPAFTQAMMKAGVSEDIIKAMAARESGPTVAIASNGVAKSVYSANTYSASTPYVQPVTAPAVVAPTPIVAAISPRTAVSGTAILYQGTPVRIRIRETVSSADAQVGNNVDFETLDDIKQGGVLVIPRGSTAIGTITIAESKKRMARGGKLGMNIDYVRLPNGDQLPLRGVQNLKGGGHTGAMTGAMVATAIVFWPASPFFLFMHGKDVVIPEGKEVTVYTNTNYGF